MTAPTNNTPPVATTQMTFTDDFGSFSASADGNGTIWQDELPYDGEAAHTLSNNNETEYYSSDLSGGNSPFNDQNGVLTISAFPAASGSNPYGLAYTSGAITTAQSFSQQYGFFEVDAKLPSGQGLWPAFWLLPTDGYTAELDDFEIVDNQINTDYATVHGTTNGTWSSDSQALSAPNLSSNFNVFGVDWEPTTTTFYINGREIGAAPTPQSMNSPMYMLLNLAVGGNGSWPGAPDSTTVFPANMQIGWVEAFATANTTNVSGSAAIPAGSAMASGGSQATVSSDSNNTQPVASVQTTTVPAAQSVGSGADQLVLQMSEDAYQGDAQFTVSVNGVQQGGTYTATASDAAGQTQAFEINGNFPVGNSTVTVDFLNDAYGGTAQTDRNLYVTGATIDGTAINDASLSEYTGGPQSFEFSEPASNSTGAASSAASDTALNNAAGSVGNSSGPTTGVGPDQLVLQMSEDAYQGDAQFTVSVNGIQEGSLYTAKASHAAGQTEAFTIDGSFPTGTNTVAIDFLNDAYGGTAQTDRNLYVTGATIDGTTIGSASLTEYQGGPQSFSFRETASSTTAVSNPASSATGSTAAMTSIGASGGPAVGTGPDQLVLQMSEDAYQGNAHFKVKVDGVQQGGIYTVSAPHASGQVQNLIIDGSFGTGGHSVSVDFLNDAYGGSWEVDRNLYVDGASINGTSISNASLNEYQNGAQSFSFNGNDNEDSGQPAAVAVTAAAGASQATQDTLTVGLSEDAYQGDARASIAIDSTTLGSPTVTFLHSSGNSELFTFTGDFGGPSTSHDLAISFLNDLYAGSPSTDRNLYVNSVSFDGTSLPDQSALDYKGTIHFLIPAGPSLVVPPVLHST